MSISPQDAGAWIPAELLAQRVAEAAASEGGDAAAALIGAHWDRYATSAPQQLLAAVRALPADVFVDNLGMVVAARYLRQVVAGGDPGRFEHDHRLDALVSTREPSLGEELIVLTGAVATARTTGRLSEALEAVQRGRKRLSEAPPADIAAVRGNLPHLRFQWARTLDTMDDDSAQAEYEEVHHLAAATEQPQIARRAAAHLAWRLVDRGYLTEGERWMRLADATGEPAPRYDAPLHLTRALLHLERQDSAASASALARIAPADTGDLFAGIIWVRAWLAQTAAERALVEADLVREFQRVPESVTTTGANRRYLQAARQRLELAQEETDDAQSSDEHTMLAVAAYRRGELHHAAAHADPALQVGAGPRSRATAAMVGAAAALALGRTTVAREEFTRAHTIIEHERMYTRYELIAREHLDELARLTLGTAIEVPLRDDARRTAPRLAALTPREREVLTLLAGEGSFATIARQLFISPNTLKATTSRLYRKLGVNSRHAAADIAQRAGLVRTSAHGRGTDRDLH